MPLLGTRGAGSAKGFGLTAGRSISYPFDIEFLVIAGGGGATELVVMVGGGGAGGYRTSTQSITGTQSNYSNSRWSMVDLQGSLPQVQVQMVLILQKYQVQGD
jgi:hypothetical protein